MIRKIITTIFVCFVNSQFLTLMASRNKTIAEKCWIMDTNNLTEIGLGNCISEIYFVKLGVGTPPQQLNFQLDTIRDLIWSPLQQGFEYNSSETFQISENKTVTYYHQSLVKANLGSEMITIDQTDIKARSPIAWTQQIDIPFQPFIYGLLGLGYSSTPNFFDCAYKIGEISSPVFALQMKSMLHQSMIYYNNLPQWLQDQTTYVPVIGQASWKVKLQSFKVGNMDYSFISSKKLILDSSNSLLYLNPNLYNTIVDKYFKKCIKKGLQLICPKDYNFPTFTLVLEALTLDITPANYARSYDDQYLLIMIGQTTYQNGSILVGSVLMKNYIVTFDKNQHRIGFNGQKLSIWPTIFYICQFSMIGMMGLILGFGLYSLWEIRVKKKSKEDKENAKKLPKTKKGKKYQKPEISLTFLEY